MHFRGTHIFLLKNCSRSARRPARGPRSVYRLRRAEEKGVTLIDAVVGTALVLTVFLGINAAFRLTVDVVTNNKARAGAIALADQRMEYIRSLSYASIGTVGGIPSGSLAQSETLALNGVTYTRRTVVVYADDPKDGTGASDSNSITADYKAVKVDVAWTTRLGGTRHVDLVSRVSPPTGMESNPCSGPCGTLVINVVSSQSQPVAGASVTITNPTASPAVNFGTFTNTGGAVTLIGAPAASGYHIVVTNTGYSTAQTYDAVPPNVNPSPGNLTVSNNLTTSATFAIDTLGTKQLYTWTWILDGAWVDTFADSTKIATSTDIAVSGGIAKLNGTAGSYPSYGELQTIAVGHSTMDKWGTFTASLTKPANTTVLFRFYDGGGSSLIPEAQLPGNAAGFATTSVDLSGVSTSTYPAIRVDSTLGSSDADVTPSINSYTVGYTYGPEKVSNIDLTLQGAKTIGTNASNQPIYKYSQLLNSGSSGGVVVPSLEFDTYNVSVSTTTTGYDVVGICNPQSENTSNLQQFSFAPGSLTSTNLYLSPHTANSVAVKVVASADGSVITGASVRLQRSGYDTTKGTDSCGQTFFSGLTAGTYSLLITATGYQAYSVPSLNVTEATQYKVVMN